MRELGSVFQLRRTPSVSSIWPHWSLSASKSAIVGRVYVEAAVVFGQCLVEGNEGAHNSTARGWRCASGAMGGFDDSRAINSVAAAQTGCNNTAGLQGVLSRSSRRRWRARHKRPDWQLRSSIPSLAALGLASLATSKTRIFQPSVSSSLHRQHYKHYLTAALSSPMARPVFALRVEKTRPMAGRPTWINSF